MLEISNLLQSILWRFLRSLATCKLLPPRSAQKSWCTVTLQRHIFEFYSVPAILIELSVVFLRHTKQTHGSTLKHACHFLHAYYSCSMRDHFQLLRLTSDLCE